MNRKINLIILILHTVFIVSSCQQPFIVQPKPENVCTLTKETFPEVRGFRLGMPFQQIDKKIPGICKSPSSPSQINMRVRFNVYEESEFNRVEVEKDKKPWLYTGKIEDCISSPSKNLNLKQYPEFEGVETIEIEITKGYLSNVEIRYEESKDFQFGNTFIMKVKDSLGLSQFTNWNPSESKLKATKYPKAELFEQVKTDQLLCNKIAIKAEIKTDRFSYFEKNQSDYIIYKPILSLSESDEVARSESQKKQSAEEYRLMQEKKKEEDKKKGETFKP